MALNQFLDLLWGWAKTTMPPIITAAIVFIIGWLLIKLFMKALSGWLSRSKLDVTLHAFTKSLVKIALIVLLAISCLTMTKLVDPASVVTALGAVGLALSLAVKDGLANLAGGLVLLATKPFAVGDYIEVDGMGGTVAKIDLVHTMLRTVDNKQIFIPNGVMSNERVVNFSAAPLRRLDLEFPIDYADNFEHAKAVISAIVERHPLALHDPAPLVRLLRHDHSALVLVLRVWVESGSYWDLHFDLMEQVKLAFDSEGLHIPFHQIDVHLMPPIGAAGEDNRVL